MRGDREALGRALWNLLDNAVKYSPDSKTVWVEAACEGDQVAIRVRDQGVGIAGAVSPVSPSASPTPVAVVSTPLAHIPSKTSSWSTLAPAIGRPV